MSDFHLMECGMTIWNQQSQKPQSTKSNQRFAKRFFFGKFGDFGEKFLFKCNAAEIYTNTTSHCEVTQFFYKHGPEMVYVLFTLNISAPQDVEVPGQDPDTGEARLTRFIVWDVTNSLLRQCPVFLKLEVVVG